jgi:hypothetical protein
VPDVRRLAIALEDDVAEAVGRAADRAGVSVSAWLNEAAVHELRFEEALPRLPERERGQPDIDLSAAADLLGRLLDPATPSR